MGLSGGQMVWDGSPGVGSEPHSRNTKGQCASFSTGTAWSPLQKKLQVLVASGLPGDHGHMFAALFKMGNHSSDWKLRAACGAENFPPSTFPRYRLVPEEEAWVLGGKQLWGAVGQTSVASSCARGTPGRGGSEWDQGITWIPLGSLGQGTSFLSTSVSSSLRWGW